MKILDSIPWSTKLMHFPPEQAFFIKCKGRGMIPEIHEFDMCLCQETKDFKNGDLIAVESEVKGEKLEVWQAFKQEKQVILRKINLEYHSKTSLINLEDLKIVGVIRTVIKTVSLGQF